jgi:exodeoxyribonuclease III
VRLLHAVSWNVNGVRACARNGFCEWLRSQKNDIVLLQEVRADLAQIPADLLADGRYHKYWNPSRAKKGYSGVALFSREIPLRVTMGLGIEEFDIEGRVLTAEFADFTAISAYFPNSQEAGKRVDYKIRFCTAIAAWADALRRRGKPVLLGGDFNVAPQPIDLTHPRENEGNPGYLPEERAWMADFLDSGWVDSFRFLHPTSVKYSWWSLRSGARARNIGWRIDHFAVPASDRDRLQGADCLNEVLGSDHCPISVALQLDR